jgi:hypothetical protein
MFDYKIISKTEYQNLKYDIEHLIQKNKSLKSEIFEVKKYYRDMDHYIIKAKAVFYEERILYFENKKLTEKIDFLIKFIKIFRFLISFEAEHLEKGMEKIDKKYEIPLYDKITEFEIHKFEFINFD